MKAGKGTRRRRAQRGHTLVELTTVVAVAAIAAALAYPSLSGSSDAQRLETAAVGLARQLRLAHWRAVATGERVRVAGRQEPGGVWRFSTEREEGAAWAAAGEDLRIPRSTVVSISGAADKVFNPDGTCSVGGITLRGAGGFYRCTLAAATGRVRLYRGEREAGRGL